MEKIKGKEKVLIFLKEQNKEMHTSYIAMMIKMSWNYVMMYLGQLEKDQIVTKEIRKGRGGLITYWKLTNGN